MTPTTATLVWCVLQVTLFSLAAGVLYLAVRKVSSGAGGTLLAQSFVLVLVLTLLSVSPWPRWQWPTQASPENQTASSGPSRTDSLDQPHQSGRPGADFTSPLTEAWRAFAQRAVSPSDSSASTFGGNRIGAMTIFWGVVLATLAVSLIRFARAVRQVRLLLRGSFPIEDEKLSRLARELALRLDLPLSVALRESDKVATPATVGWRRQHILLPSTWREWTDDETRAALAHELSHVASHDYRSWLVARLAVAIHFYHPLVRWLASRLQLEQELAADARAARLMGDRRLYLQCLASLALATPNHRLAGPARTLIPSRSLLLRRVEMLRTQKRSQNTGVPNRRFRGLVVAMLAAVAFGVAGFRQPTVSHAEEPVASGPGAGSETSVEQLPLSLIPDDAVGVVSLRPARALAGDRHDAAVGLLDATELVRGLGVSVRDITEVLFILRADPSARERIVIRCATEGACLSAVNGMLRLPPDKKLTPESDTRVLLALSRSVTRLDDRTAIVEIGGDERTLNENPVSHRWAEQWLRLEEHGVVAAVSLDTMPVAMRNELYGVGPAQTFKSTLDRVDWAVAGIRLDDGLGMDAIAQCESAEFAERTAEMLRAVLTLAGGFLDQHTPDKSGLRGDALASAVLLHAIAKDVTTAARPTSEGNRVRFHFGAQGDVTRQIAQTIAPALDSGFAASSSASSMNNLKRLALAMHVYADQHGGFPPAVLHKEGSLHPYSWRVALLPYLDEQALYNTYRFDEPWDSEANMRVAQTVVPVFQSPYDQLDSTNTSYFVLTGPDTVFPGNEGTKFPDIIDGTSNTMLIVEARRPVPWTKPEDIPYDAQAPIPALGGWQADHIKAAFCDGAAHALRHDIAESELRAIITPNGREPVDWERW